MENDAKYVELKKSVWFTEETKNDFKEETIWEKMILWKKVWEVKI